jgi:hypothetical protein
MPRYERRKEGPTREDLVFNIEISVTRLLREPHTTIFAEWPFIFIVEKGHHISNRTSRTQGIDTNVERAFLLTNGLYGMIGLQRARYNP